MPARSTAGRRLLPDDRDSHYLRVFGAILISIISVVLAFLFVHMFDTAGTLMSVATSGRTGLTTVTVGILFVAAMFFAPLAGMIPASATAGALIYVAMLRVLCVIFIAKFIFL